MSFLDEFYNSIYEPWYIEYVAYEPIYNGLYESCNSGKWTTQDEEDFESAIRLEAGKVDMFINRKQREIESRIAYCERALCQHNNSSETGQNNSTDNDDALSDILADINELARFTRINFKALQNLIQEHDRLTNTNRQPLLVEVCRTRPLDNQRFDKILVHVSSLLDICRNRSYPSSSQLTLDSQDGVDVQQQTSSANYWVHRDNVTEVKAMLLFNLPIYVSDPSEEFEESGRPTSTVYFDNNIFSQYGERLQHDDGAEIIRCRWFGDMESSKKVTIEKKKFVKTDQGERSLQDSIDLEQDRIADFIAHSYSAEEYASDLKSNGFSDQDYVNSSYTVAQSIQRLMLNKQLQPKLRVYCNRLRFESPRDHTLSVTLDNDMAFAKEDGVKEKSNEWRRMDMNIDYPFKKVEPQDDLYLFPHSILETRLVGGGEVPSWLSKLLDSNLVYEVPRFSAYLHGVAHFWRPMLPLLPWWLSRLEIDIRTNKNQQESGSKTADFFAGLNRSNSLKPLIKGEYRMGYLESQLGKKEGDRRHRHALSASINSDKSIGSSVVGNQNNTTTDNHLVSDNKSESNRTIELAEQVSSADRKSASISLHRIATNTSSTTSKARLRSRYLDNNDSNNSGNSNFIKTYYNGRNYQSQAYMLQDVNTVKQDDELRRAAIIQMEEEDSAKEKKKQKKTKPRTHTMEPKQFFANERTFIHWLQFSAIILTAALTLLNFGDTITTISGATFFGVSLVLALYAFFRYRYRAHQMSTRPDVRYDDLYGPIGLCVLLVGAMILNFVLRFMHPSSTDTYLGISNQTDQQSNNQTV